MANPVDFPTGLAISTERGVYFIKNRTRFRFGTDRVFKSWGLDPILADYAAIKPLVWGGVLGFRDGTLINNVADGKMYLVSENKRRHITSPDVFEKYGLDREKMLDVSDEEANIQKLGAELK